MRSLGAGSSTIVIQCWVEGILGLPLSYFVGNAIHAAVELESFFRFDYPILVAIQGLIGIIALAGVASAWPSIAAARKTVSDILRYQ
jgi:ABC-type antimicrobial peptide transport system permease subunit